MEKLYATTRQAFLGARNRQMQVDWFRIITELRGRGHSLDTIGKSIGVPRGTVHVWTTGTTPNYTDGMALMELWETTITQVPLTVSTSKRLRK